MTITRGVAIHDWDGRWFDLARAVYRTPFNRIYLTVEDRHVLWRDKQVVLAVNEFKNFGFEVYLDPWGVAGKFAGEATNEPGHEFEWLELAGRTRADGFLLDEPRGGDWEDTVNDWLVMSEIACPNLKVILGLQPERDLKKWSESGRVSELAVSTYFFPPRIGRIGNVELVNQIEDWDRAMPPDASVWVQTWNVPAGQEWMVTTSIEEWEHRGRNVNIWSWDATRTVSKIAPDNPDKVWEKVIEGFDPLVA